MFNRRQLLHSSGRLIAAPIEGFFSHGALTAINATSTERLHCSPVNKALFDFVNDGLAQAAAKTCRRVVRPRHLIAAAQGIKLAARHINDTGLEIAIQAISCKTDLARYVLPDAFPWNEMLELLKKYDSTITRQELVMENNQRVTELTESRINLTKNGITSYLLDSADVLKTTSRRARMQQVSASSLVDRDSGGPSDSVKSVLTVSPLCGWLLSLEDIAPSNVRAFFGLSAILLANVFAYQCEGCGV